MGFFSGLLEKGLDAVVNAAKEMTDSRPVLEGEFPEKFYFDGDKSVMENVISQLNDLKEPSLYFAFTPAKRSHIGGLLGEWNSYTVDSKSILSNFSKKAFEYVAGGYVYGIRKYHKKEKLDAGEKRKILYTDKLSFYIGKAPSAEEMKNLDERVFENTCSYIHSYSYEEEEVDLINKLFHEKIIDFTSAEIKRLFNGVTAYKYLAHGSSASLKVKNSGDEKGILKKLDEKIQNNQIDDILDKAKNDINDQSVILEDNKYVVKLTDGSSLEIARLDSPKFRYFSDDESIYLKYTNASGNYIAMHYPKGGIFSVRFCTGTDEIENVISFYKDSYIGERKVKEPVLPESLADILYFVMDSDAFYIRIFDLKLKLMNLYEARNLTKLRNAYISLEETAEKERLSKLAEKKKKVDERKEFQKKRLEEQKMKENKERQTQQALDDF